MNKCKWCDKKILIINECKEVCNCSRCQGFCMELHYSKYLDKFGKFGEEMKERKIVDYKIVLLDRQDYDPQEEINHLIKDGYQPYGIPYNSHDMEPRYRQAMVKYED